MEKKVRSNLLDAVKVMMAFLVISIHTLIPSSELKYLLTQGIARIAVPFFFLSAGYFFSGKDSYDDVKNVLKRLIILYVAWWIFYLPFISRELYDNNFTLAGFSFNLTLLIIKGWCHLWFMPAMILGMYTYYFLRKSKWLYVVALALYVTGVIMQNTIEPSQFSILYYRNFLLFGFPLIALGSLLRGSFFSNTSVNKLIITLAALIPALIVESLIKFRVGIYNNDMLITAPIVASILILLAVNASENIVFDTKTMATSIYFIHFFFYLVLKNYIANDTNLFLSVLSLSVLFSLIMRKSLLYRKFFT
ncbi:acyltransferase family protein [Pantoea anthophila]|uniref:acyltransferase family protein n=1 Tax=Pantoea anthophila TaxID=470931 RepID=UPI003015CBBF